MREAAGRKQGAGTQVRQNSAEQGRRQCLRCHGFGHFAKFCPEKQTTGRPEARNGRLHEKLVVARISVPLQDVALCGSTEMQPVTKKASAVEVSLLSGGDAINARIDSEADITAIRRSLLPRYECAGSTIMLAGAFGKQVVAESRTFPLLLPKERRMCHLARRNRAPFVQSQTS